MLKKILLGLLFIVSFFLITSSSRTYAHQNWRGDCIHPLNTWVACGTFGKCEGPPSTNWVNDMTYCFVDGFGNESRCTTVFNELHNTNDPRCQAFPTPTPPPSCGPQYSSWTGATCGGRGIFISCSPSERYQVRACLNSCCDVRDLESCVPDRTCSNTPAQGCNSPCNNPNGCLGALNNCTFCASNGTCQRPVSPPNNPPPNNPPPPNPSTCYIHRSCTTSTQITQVDTSTGSVTFETCSGGKTCQRTNLPVSPNIVCGGIWYDCVSGPTCGTNCSSNPSICQTASGGCTQCINGTCQQNPFNNNMCKCDTISSTAIAAGGSVKVTAFGKVMGTDTNFAKISSFSFFLYESAKGNPQTNNPTPTIVTATQVINTPTLARYQGIWTFTAPSDPTKDYRIMAKPNCTQKLTSLPNIPNASTAVLGDSTENNTLIGKFNSFMEHLFGKRVTNSDLSSTSTPPANQSVLAATSKQNLQLEAFYPATKYEIQGCDTILFSFSQ